MNNNAMIKQYSKVSKSLACLSNEEIKKILANASGPVVDEYLLTILFKGSTNKVNFN